MLCNHIKGLSELSFARTLPCTHSISLHVGFLWKEIEGEYSNARAGAEAKSSAAYRPGGWMMHWISLLFFFYFSGSVGNDRIVRLLRRLVAGLGG